MIGAQFASVVVVVWREGVEALLIVGILNVWLRSNDVGGRGQRYLWAGAATGLLIAAGFGTTIALFGGSIPPGSRQIYGAVAALLAAGLMVHMVGWIRGQALTLRLELETALRQESMAASWWGMFTLAALAIAREGAESILFVLGALASVGQVSPAEPVLGAVVGLGLAVATYLALQAGSRVITWRRFFRVTEAMMLLMAAALLISGLDTLTRLGMLPATGRLWDSSAVLPDSGPVGALVAGLTSYRAQPTVLQLGVYLAYWAGIALLLHKTSPSQAMVVAENQSEVQR
jgi:high-affinity iron transporter